VQQGSSAKRGENSGHAGQAPVQPKTDKINIVAPGFQNPRAPTHPNRQTLGVLTFYTFSFADSFLLHCSPYIYFIFPVEAHISGACRELGLLMVDPLK
jgi:hypothetical protein